MNAQSIDDPQRRFAPWLLLFSALTACGGHGLLLGLALFQGGYLDDPGRIGGRLALGVTAWFLLCAPLALVAALARKALQRSGYLWAAALLAAVVSTASFAYYLREIVPAG